MKKMLVYVFIILSLLSLTLTFAPKVAAQADSLKVLNYSYHIDYQNNILIVYGEVQNIGSTPLSKTLMGGSVLASDGTVLSSGQGQAYCQILVPGQKVPFEIDFNAPKSSADGTWFTASISKIEISGASATQTNQYPYPDLKITGDHSYIDTTVNASGTYWVTGTIQNTGNQIASNIWVVATFYNSSGATVSAGWASKINSLAPSAPPTTFLVGAFDINMSQVSANQKITSYALSIQPGAPVLQGIPPNASVYSSSTSSDNSQSGQSSTPTAISTSTDSGSGKSSFNIQWLIFGAIAVIVVVSVVIVIKTLPKRENAENTKTKHKTSTGPPSKLRSKTPQGKVR